MYNLEATPAEGTIYRYERDIDGSYVRRRFAFAESYLVEHERTGLLCKPGDWRALAANVVRLLEQPDLASGLARSAYEESRRYHWDVVRAQWLNAYRSLCPLSGWSEASIEVLLEAEPKISEVRNTREIPQIKRN